MRQRKTREVFELWVNYGYGDGFEHEITENTKAEARQRRREYRENCPQYPVEIRVKRERIIQEELMITA